MSGSQLELGGGTAGLEKAYAKAAALEAKAVAGAKAANEKMKRHAADQRRAFLGANEASFGRHPQSQITAWAAKLGLAAAAAGVLRKALADVNAERERGARSAETAGTALGSLAQIATGAGDMRMLGSATRGAYRAGAGSMEEAKNLVFTLRSLESLSVEKDIGTFQALFGIADPRAMAEGVDQVMAAFGGKEAGSSREVLNKLFAGARASKTTAQAFAPAVGRAAASSRLVGGSDEELMALISVLASPAGTAEEAGTWVGALNKAIGKKGFGGEGTLAGAQALWKRLEGKSAKSQIKMLGGRQEALAGLSAIMQNLPTIQGRLAEMQEAGAAPEGADILTGILGAAESDPSFIAARRLRRAKARKVLAEEDPEELTYQARAEEAVAKGREKGRGWIERKGAEWGAGAIHALTGLDPHFGVDEGNATQWADDMKSSVREGLREGVSGGRLAPETQTGDLPRRQVSR